MIKETFTIQRKNGIDLDFANHIANVADRYDAWIHFVSKDMDVNCKSIINLISGKYRMGDTIECWCQGADEKEAMEAMKEIF